MSLRWLTTLGLMLGLHMAPAGARSLTVELEFQHIGGLLPAAELDSMLASRELQVMATYEPRWLIPGITATRQAIMPIGSKLVPILQRIELPEQQIERSARRLSFAVTQKAPAHRGYQLANLQLFLPMAAGVGRPQPNLEIILPQLPGSGQAAQHGVLSRQGSIELGIRLRYRWSDADAAMTLHPPTCGGDVQQVDAEHYRFRPQHSHAGLFRDLSPAVHSDPPTQAPAGQRSFQLREPLPAALQGWQLARQHLLQQQLAGVRLERLSLYATRAESAQCQHSLSYEALFADGQLVEMERSNSAQGCAEAAADSRWINAHWLNDASLARLASSQGNNPARLWDAFALGEAAACTSTAEQPASQPPAAQQAELQRAVQELQQLRQAFLAD